MGYVVLGSRGGHLEGATPRWRTFNLDGSSAGEFDGDLESLFDWPTTPPRYTVSAAIAGAADPPVIYVSGGEFPDVYLGAFTFPDLTPLVDFTVSPSPDGAGPTSVGTLGVSVGVSPDGGTLVRLGETTASHWVLDQGLLTDELSVPIVSYPTGFLGSSIYVYQEYDFVAGEASEIQLNVGVGGLSIRSSTTPPSDGGALIVGVGEDSAVVIHDIQTNEIYLTDVSGNTTVHPVQPITIDPGPPPPNYPPSITARDIVGGNTLINAGVTLLLYTPDGTVTEVPRPAQIQNADPPTAAAYVPGDDKFCIACPDPVNAKLLLLVVDAATGENGVVVELGGETDEDYPMAMYGMGGGAPPSAFWTTFNLSQEVI